MIVNLDFFNSQELILNVFNCNTIYYALFFSSKILSF